MRRWTHGHSLGAGVGFGLLTATHSWAWLIVAFSAGVALGRLWALVEWTAGALRDKVLHARQEKAKLKPVSE